VTPRSRRIIRRIATAACGSAVALIAACPGETLPTGQSRPALLAAVTGDGQSGIVAQSLAAPLVVLVADAQGLGVAGTAVTWTVVSGGGSLSAGNTTTGASGQTSVTLTLGPAAGANVVSAAVSGLPPVTFTESGLPRGASGLAFAVQPGNAVAGAAISPSVQVSVRDSLGNVLTTSTASITLALSGGTGTAGASLRGTRTDAAAGGVAP